MLQTAPPKTPTPSLAVMFNDLTHVLIGTFIYINCINSYNHYTLRIHVLIFPMLFTG